MVTQWHVEKYDPLWQCMYCGEKDRTKLTDEHIIPFALHSKGGDWALPKSSCSTCAGITSQFEGQVLRDMFGPQREQLDLRTRNRGTGSKKTGRMLLRKNNRNGKIWDEEISVSSFPKLCVGFNWPVPGILFGETPTSPFKGELIVKCDPEEMRKYTTDGEAFRIARVGPLNFARMLAKIAHSFAVAKYGLEAFDPLLPPLILGQTDIGPHLVGGDARKDLPDQPGILHDVFRSDCRRDDNPAYFAVAIRLFAMVGMPRYHVIVGRCLKEAPESERRGDPTAVEFLIPRR